MIKKIFTAAIVISEIVACNAQNKSNTIMENNKPLKFNYQLTEEEWKQKLSPEQYYILRQKGTERPFSGKYNFHKEKGVYVCAGCGNELFTSDMKFESHCGWPSFDREIEGGKILKLLDKSYGMIRTEIICANCGGHLGHLFDDGPTETGMRYCVNSLSLDFKKID
jgi:peptide-methionine (R)-S-oxide reductase